MSTFTDDLRGPYDGSMLLSQVTGVPLDEVRWMARRMIELFKQGVSREECKRIVREEAEGRPWEVAP